ncbi:MAG: hypothetical protein Kow0077_15700 [Anaerolineae bacterium]
MNPQALTDAEMGVSLEVRQAIHDFVAALTDSPQYEMLEHANEAVQRDETASQAIEAYQARQQSLQMMIMLNALSNEDRAELERLRQAVLANPTVVDLVRAQNEFRILCQTTANLVSDYIGMDFAVSGGSCCG